MTGYDPDLSEQAWNDALSAHKHLVPRGLTDEQVAEQFPAVVQAALKGLLGLQINHIRKQHGHPPIPMMRVKIPQSVQTWLRDQINALDAATGRVGSRSYGSLANGLLSQLRGLEHHFLGRHE